MKRYLIAVLLALNVMAIGCQKAPEVTTVVADTTAVVDSTVVQPDSVIVVQ